EAAVVDAAGEEPALSPQAAKKAEMIENSSTADMSLREFFKIHLFETIAKLFYILYFVFCGDRLFIHQALQIYR
ncbi:MAG: hypothetical protein IJT56_06455, partial [Clostridia bacterium]|nr:hypothetical protein [Clostridia bacterium]